MFMNNIKRLMFVKKLDNTLNYINWIIYPSIDHRQHESQRDLQNWFQSRQGKPPFLKIFFYSHYFVYNRIKRIAGNMVPGYSVEQPWSGRSLLYYRSSIFRSCTNASGEIDGITFSYTLLIFFFVTYSSNS